MAEVKSDLQMRSPDGTFKRDYLATRIAVEHRKKRRKAREEADPTVLPPAQEPNPPAPELVPPAPVIE